MNGLLLVQTRSKPKTNEVQPDIYGPLHLSHLLLCRQVDKTDETFKRRSRKGCVFSVQCGSHTHFMAAASPAEAKVWPDLQYRALPGRQMGRLQLFVALLTATSPAEARSALHGSSPLPEGGAPSASRAAATLLPWQQVLLRLGAASSTLHNKPIWCVGAVSMLWDAVHQPYSFYKGCKPC